MSEIFESYKNELDRVRLTEDSKRALAESLSRRKAQTGTRPRRMKVGRIAAVAAVVCLLAGTAAAVGYFGKVDFEFINNSLTGNRKGYSVYGSGVNLSVENLSEDVLKLCADIEWSGDKTSDRIDLPFDSWPEAEAYLGIELADNAVMEQLWKYEGLRYWGTAPTGKKEEQSTSCLLSIGVSRGQRLPSHISLSSTAQKGNCFFIEQSAYLFTDAVGEGERTNITAYLQGESDFEEYVTPNGLEATICLEVIPAGNYNQFYYKAFFEKNNALFEVKILSDENIPQRYSVYYDPLETLKEILDAYE